MDSFSIRRNLPEGRYQLKDLFSGLENSPELQLTFGGKISDINDVCVVITGYVKLDKPPYLNGKLEYAYINDGEIHIGTDYFRNGREDHIYLDMIHELTHIKQHRDGLDLFDLNYDYIDRPTEIEGYKAAMLAAKRLGMSREEIIDYLAVPWCSKEEMRRLHASIGL